MSTQGSEPPMEPTEPEGEKPPKAKKKTCGARKKGGGLCREWKNLGAGGRCKWHGGATPSGVASPNWKHGKRSRWAQHLPKNGLAEQFNAAHGDRQLFQTRRLAALVDTMIVDRTRRLKEGKALSEREERRITNLVEQLRRLQDSEARRLVQLQQMVTAAQFNNVVGAIVTLVREFVPAERLRDAQRRLEQLLLAAPAMTTEGGSDD